MRGRGLGMGLIAGSLGMYYKKTDRWLTVSERKRLTGSRGVVVVVSRDVDM